MDTSFMDVVNGDKKDIGVRGGKPGTWRIRRKNIQNCGINKRERGRQRKYVYKSSSGLCDVEIKLLDGLEVMLVFDTPETATNIIRSIDHGIRRWVHKLRRWSKEYILSGRLTWIDIIGCPSFKF
ncbi:hypothetical protein Tco_0002859 [Tanacetum coccineum]